MKRYLLAAVLAGSCNFANAETLQFTDVYYGAGLSSNEADNFDDAAGYQIFSGYDFGYKLGPFSTAIEAGYMNSGDFDYSRNTSFGPIQFSTEAKGVWASGHVAYAFAGAFNALGRVGYDFGDDDGVLFGAGVDYRLSNRFALRAEYIARDTINSLQFNVVYFPFYQ